MPKLVNITFAVIFLLVVLGFHQPITVLSQGVCYWCQPWQPPQQRPSYNPYRPSNNNQGVTYHRDGTCTAKCKAEAYCVGWTRTPSMFGTGYDVFNDVSLSDRSSITNELAACRAFIEQYAEAPVPAANMSKVIGEAFYANAQQKKKNENGLLPSTFHCCHKDYSRALIPAPQPEQIYEDVELPKDVTCKSLTGTLFKELGPHRNDTSEIQH